MAHITYEIPMLSARGIISYAEKQDDEKYVFNLNNSATAKCLMNKENSLQEDCAMFYQLMSVLTSDKFTQPKDDTKISDLSDVIVYIDFSGIFDREAKSERIRLRQLKAKSMFRPEGINIDLGTGMKNFIAFERSASMSRNARLSFIRSDVCEKVKARIQLDMNIGLCQLSKLYAYNGLMFSGGTRIESKHLFDKDSIVIIKTWERFIKTHAVTVTSKDKNTAVKKYNRAEKDIEFSCDSFDGEGFISPSFAKEIDKQFCGKHIHSSFQIRLPYIKGMVHKVDFKSFLKSLGIYSVKDMWGVEHPVDKINLIITDTMFKGKGWLSENNLSFNDYLDRCKKYRHSLYISNVGKGENENLTELNFQFLNTVAIPEEKFRPKDLPLGWKESPSRDKREWLTKATEQAYYDYCNNRKYRIDYYTKHLDDGDEDLKTKARLINKNSLLIDEPFFAKDIEDIAENILRKYAIGQLFVEGDNRYLSADLMSLFAFLADGSRKFAAISNEELSDNFVYAPGNSYGTNYKYSLLRNPHISKNESVQVRPLKDVGYYRNKYFSHLTDVIMVPDNSDIPMRLGGADFDGDMVKTIADSIIISYLYTKETEPEYYGKSDNPLPLLFIPTEEPIVSDATDWEARFETVKNTFSSRVGQISNAALNRSILAYDENAKGKKAQYRKETETLAILTGLEIDSAKSGVKPDLSEYLVTNKAPKSLFLKYKSSTGVRLMLNEIAEFKDYTEAPIYKRDNKNDNSFLGRFTREGIQGFEGFPRVLTIIARGYMFKNGSADIEYARRAISAWCSIPDKDNSKEKEDWRFRTDFREYHSEFPELVSENGEGWFYRHFHNAMKFVISKPDKFTAKEIEKYSILDKKFDTAWRDKVTRMHFSTYYLKTKGAWILRFDDILSSALELGELKNKDFELSEETKVKIADFTQAPSTAYAFETLIKYYYVNRQEDTDWVVLPVANFDAYFGSTSFSKKRLTELVKSGAIERENSYNVSRYRLNEVFT